jgi:hypothetical protein
MPQWVENCVESMMKDPNFKGTREEAWAICTARYKKLQKGDVGDYKGTLFKEKEERTKP